MDQGLRLMDFPPKTPKWPRATLVFCFLALFFVACSSEKAKEATPPPPPEPDVQLKQPEPPDPTDKYGSDQVLKKSALKLLGNLTPVDSELQVERETVGIVSSPHALKALARFYKKHFPTHELKYSAKGLGFTLEPRSQRNGALRITVAQKAQHWQGHLITYERIVELRTKEFTAPSESQMQELPAELSGGIQIQK